MKKIIIALIVVMAIAFFYFFPGNKYVSLLRTQFSNLKSNSKDLLNEEKDRRGQIEYVEGKVEKREGEDDGWRQVEQGEVMKRGTELRTLAKSRAVVTFEDGSVVRLNENSQIELDSGDDFLKLLLSGGAVYNRVAEDDSRIYIVSVGDFEVVALGTAFGVEKNEQDILKVQVVENQVEVNKGEENKLGLVEEGKKAEFSNKDIELKTAQLTDQDKREEFLAWNLSNDEEYFQKKKEAVSEKVKTEEVAKEEEVKEETKKVETKKEIVKESSDGYATSISLKGKEDGEKARFSWTISGGKAPKGFKIVKSKQPNPVFPGDDYLYIKDPDDRSAVWKGFKKDKTYYFRICVYKGGECGTYSENVKIDFD